MKTFYQLLFYVLLGYASIQAMEGERYQLGKQVIIGWLDAPGTEKNPSYGSGRATVLLDQQGRATGLYLWGNRLVVEPQADSHAKLIGVLKDSVLVRPEPADIDEAYNIWHLDVSEFKKN